MKKLGNFYLCAMLVAVLLTTGLTSCVTAKKKAILAQNKPLTETYWVLTHVKGESIPKPIVTPWMTFDPDGRYYGNLGCNQYAGKYQSRKDHIKMEFDASTKKLCHDMKVEKLFLQALRAEFKKYEINKDVLYLKDANGEVLRFVAGEKPE